MADTGIDYLALSGHKLYAPFGAGALVACGPALERGEPLLHGGGAIELVTLDDVEWADAPERYEAGSPNVVGAVALGAACRILGQLGMQRVEARERGLSVRLATASRACRGCGGWRCGTTRPSTASAWRPSSSTATAIRCWPRS